MSHFIEEPLPHWAQSRSKGQYTELGAQLCTRDGRRTGNACVVAVLPAPEDPRWTFGEVYEVVTDMGTSTKLTLLELEGLFHPPEYIFKVDKIVEFTELNKKRYLEGSI
tara:strand:- start:109 stop:435 length:327 start_codon:yes stop_codon:yes gene_type:complete